jgi:hypothetical protein
VLSEVQDQYPLGFSTFDLWFARYEAGAGSEALLHDWKTEGDRLSEAVCATGVHLLGGNRFLVRRVRERCKQASGEGLGYLTTESEAPRWEQWLTLFGTRFRRVDLDGAVLFDSLAPRSMAGAERLSPAGWKAHANVGPGDEALAFDGRLETRWGSGGPQRRGMAFTIELPQATDISWLRIRMGSFTRDCARSLAVETSTDGDRWQRLEAPLMAKSIRWRDGVPEEHTDGNLDLWLDRRGVRFVRLVNLSEHPHLDWSIPELEIDGTPARESA